MKYRVSASASVTLAMALLVSLAPRAQQPAKPSPTPASLPPAQNTQTTRADDEEVVRITTTLVQLDVTVTDRQGRTVPGLRASDFEIFQDGRPQPITHFSFIQGASARGAVPAAPVSRATPADKLAPPRTVRRNEVKRTMAIVVDDLCMDATSISRTRQALRKMVDEQLQPDDLVAILRTRSDVGALQQFTFDKRLLRAAIDKIRFTLRRPGVCNNPPSAFSSDEFGDTTGSASGQVTAVNDLTVLDFVVRGMKALPGRKSVVLFSDGLTLSEPGDTETISPLRMSAQRRLIEDALRSSVIIYTVHAPGLETLFPTAGSTRGAPNPPDVGLARAPVRSPSQLGGQLQQASANLWAAQSGLIYLAQQTGGVAFRNSNDLFGGVRRALDEQENYYILGYRPDDRTFEATGGGRRFHSWNVRVRNHPDLTVRFRKGFFGYTDTEKMPGEATRGEQLAAALASPFGAGDINVKLTTFFNNEAATGSFIRSLLHFDARGLTFTAQPDGWNQSVIDVMAVTFDENGRVVDQVNQIETVRAKGNKFQSLMRNGLVYRLDVPVKKAGIYQFRIAVRDSSTGKVGSAGEVIEVPDVANKRLALSDIMLSANLEPAREQSSIATPPAARPNPSPSRTAADGESATGGSGQTDAETSPTSRRFQQGAIIDYACFIFNAPFDSATHKPQVRTQVRLYREGQLVFSGQEQPYNFETAPQADMLRLPMAGRLQLGAGMEPGEYVLQVIATDPAAKQSTATRWIDFEIVPGSAKP